MRSSALSGRVRCSCAVAGRCRSSRRSSRRGSRRSSRASRCPSRPCIRRTSACGSRTCLARSPQRRSSSAAGPHLADNGRYSTPLAAELADDVLDRFLRYVRIDTQSNDDSTSYPSTAKQRDLGDVLARELGELGLEDARIDEHGYVFATLPGVRGPTVGLIAHVDTSPDESGTNVEPQVVRYTGGDIELPGDPRSVIRPSESLVLAEKLGHDIVTTDGTTLLGADDKAGVAEIMGAVAYLARHPEIEHAPIRVGFTV